MGINHPAFVVQTDRRVLVCDGTTEAACALAEFAAIEPAFALPDGIAGLNFERRGEALHFVLQGEDGRVSAGDAAAAPAYDALIARVPLYAAALAERAHPLWGVSDLDPARRIVAGQVAGVCEAMLTALTGLYSPSERLSWPYQTAGPAPCWPTQAPPRRCGMPCGSRAKRARASPSR